MRWWIVLVVLATGGLRLAGCGRRQGEAPHSPTAGPRLSFERVSAGLTFRWGTRKQRPLRNLDTFGCGCAFLDYDLDGKLDVLLVGEPVCGLFRNRGDGAFTDVTALTGLDRSRALWKGCAIGDYDGDGWPDLFLTGYHVYRLLRNDRGRRWVDRTRAAGVTGTGWGSSAGFMDLDADGDLDLVVGNYVVFGPGVQQFCEIVIGLRSGCPPHVYDPEFARLFRNNGNGTFTDVTRAAGLGAAHGKALAIGFADYDDDGRIDFYIANDGTPGDLMRNLGGLRFANTGVTAGVAMGVLNQAQAGMGVDWGDYDRDGRLDLAVTAFSDEPFSLYRNLGAYFDVVSTQVGIARPTTKPLGFGTKFLDVENDGWPDLVFANGHVYDNVNAIDPQSSYLQPLQMFRNEGGQRFREVSAEMGPDFARPILGRGLATGDYDEDGRIDLLVVDYEGEPVLLRNTSTGTGNWLALELRMPGSNRLAYGARVTVRAGDTRWVQQFSPASSYLSSSAPRLHFGLGEATRVEEIEVRWPDGRVESVRCGLINRIGRITRGTDEVRSPVPGYP